MDAFRFVHFSWIEVSMSTRFCARVVLRSWNQSTNVLSVARKCIMFRIRFLVGGVLILVISLILKESRGSIEAFKNPEKGGRCGKQQGREHNLSNRRGRT